jgi:hypothetical protein
MVSCGWGGWGNGSCVAVLENHFSVVRGLDFSIEGETLVSGSRDQVVNFWDMKSFKLKTTLPVYEVLHAIDRANLSLWKRWDISRRVMISIFIPAGVGVLFEYGIPNLVVILHKAQELTATIKKLEEYWI